MTKKIFLIGLLLVIFFCSTSLAAYTSHYAEPTITLKKGTYGTGVRWLQDMLNHNGYSLTIDGEYGSATLNAVKQFQNQYGLIVDGIVGPATKTALKKHAGTQAIRKVSIHDNKSQF